MARMNISWDDKWEYDYDGNKIVVKNGFDCCQLLVNGKVQDAHNGISLAVTLTGKLPDGKDIKVSLGGFWTMKCSVFVDHELLKPLRHD